MSDQFMLNDNEKNESMYSLMRGIDLQLSLMRFIKSHIESYMHTDTTVPYVNEPHERYGNGSYMADYVLNDNDEISEVRYDWVRD